MCRLSHIVAGGLVQTWMPTPPDPSSLDLPAKAAGGGGRKSGDSNMLILHTMHEVHL